VIASSESPTKHKIGSRHRNPRGHGAELADDIVTGALAIIERTGSSEAVTLRAVAREIGIAAPSIYAHFPDRPAIVTAAVARIFDELRAAIEAGMATRGPTQPVECLVAGCEAYFTFALRNPARYSVLFSEQRLADADYCRPVSIGTGGRPLLEFGAESFALLLDGLEACVKADKSTTKDVVADATAIWVAMHGAVSLRTALPGFPWPEPEWFVRRFVLSLGGIEG